MGSYASMPQGPDEVLSNLPRSVQERWVRLLAENERLRAEVEGVANCNVHAVELLAELDDTRTRLEAQTEELAEANDALRSEIAERRRAEDVLAERTKQLESIQTIGEEITRELDLARLLDLILRRAMEIGEASRGVIRLWDEAQQMLVPSAAHGLNLWPLRLDEGVSGVVARRREGMIVNDFRQSPYATPRHKEETAHAAVLAEPLLYRNRLVGVMALSHDEMEGPFLPETAQRLRLLSAQAAIAIENARLYTAMQRELAERARAEAVLAQERNLLRTLIDNIPDRIYIKDTAGRYVLDNAAHRHCLNAATPEEVVGKTIFDFYPKEAAEESDRADRAVVASGGMVRNQEERFVDRETGAPTWDLTTKVPLHAPDGTVTGVLSVGRDITQRKAADETLAEHARQLESLRTVGQEITRELDLTRLLDLILERALEVAQSSQGTIRLWDEAQQLLVPVTMKGAPHWSLRLGEGVAGAAAERHEGLIVNDFRTSPFATPRHLKETGHSAAVAEPLLYRDRLVGVISVSREAREGPFRPETAQWLRLLADQAAIAIENARLFQEQQRAYAELQRVQVESIRTEKLRALGQMAAGIAHDLNNMLAVILGQTELLKLRDVSQINREGFRVLETAAADGADVVRRLQDFARQQASVPLAPVDLERVVMEALDITRPRWEDDSQRRGVPIRVETALRKLPAILGHAPEVREVLTNLIFNAVDAMPNGGVLTFAGRVERDAVLLTVTDTGVGMTEEVRARIFDPFFTTKGLHGTGLGLSVVYGIMARHGGHIDVTSAPGAGTTFTLQFQIAPREMMGEGPEVPSVGVRPRCILLIDDDPGVRETLTNLLRAVGHKVTEAKSGAEGLARLAEQSFDLVLTDLGMPEMNGWEVARAVRAATPGVPVILVTGWREDIVSHDEERRLVDAVLSKPFRIHDIQRIIEQVLRAEAGETGGASP